MLQFGKLAEFSMLDDRQYRTDNPCGDGESLRCEAAETGRYTMLGYEQEQWLEQGFAESHARWNIIGQQLLIAELEHANIAENLYWNDAWDGYPRARKRLLSVENQDGEGYTEKSFIVEDGAPGAWEA